MAVNRLYWPRRARIAAGEPAVANRRHELFRPSDFDRKLIPLLDGTRDRAALLDRLTEMTLAKELTIQRDGLSLSDPAGVRDALGPVLDRTLDGLANASMLK